MNTTTEPPNVSKLSYLATSIAVALMVISVYCIGTYLHIKIIGISLKVKEATWKIDIANSVVALTYYGFSIFIHSVTYFVQDIYLLTGGVWFCYVSKIILHYGLLYILTHSMVIAALKYSIIVHTDVRKISSKERLKETFFWINLLHPIFSMVLFLLLTPDFYVQYGGFTTINVCLGNPNMNKTTFLDLCEFTAPSNKYTFYYLVYICKRIICIAQALSVYFIGFNFFDMLFYCRTFSYMRR